LKTLPVLINIPLDTLNSLIENKKKVKLQNSIGGAYAGMMIFGCSECLEYE